MIYSNNLYELRKQCKISQEKLARDLDISRRSVSKIENGEQNLSLEMAYRIAAYFEKLVQEVFPILSGEKLLTLSETKSSNGLEA